jgi:hypothetical protein
MLMLIDKLREGGGVAMATSMWLCCFCGQEIEEADSDPCRLTVQTSDGKPQYWSCHGACFKERLATEPPIFGPAHF